MLKKIIISSIPLLITINTYAKNEFSNSSVNFTIPPHASNTIINSSNNKRLYQCEFYYDDISQIIFQSIKGNNQIRTTILNEGLQGQLVEAGNEIPLILDALGELMIINKYDSSVEIDCNT